MRDLTLNSTFHLLQEIFEEFWRQLLHLFRQLNVRLTPKKIMTDFEAVQGKFIIFGTVNSLQRQTQTHKQTDRQTDRTDRQTDRQTD